MSRATSTSEPPGKPSAEPIRTGLSTETFKQAVIDNLMYLQARYPAIATTQNWYIALAHSVRDRMLERWVSTVKAYAVRDVKVACYFSAEFLIGPQLGNNLMCLGIEQAARTAIAELGQDLDALIAYETEPGLGNGGLGRLAACYLDSLASLSLPAIGYGIRYEFGIFDQEIRDGWQVETTDKWLAQGNPWEIQRPEVGWYVNFNGRTDARKLTYGDVFLQAEQEYSRYNFEFADTEMLHRHFRDAEAECKALLEAGAPKPGANDPHHQLALPAYDQCIKASHIFNLLDARGVISVTERQSFILRVRELAKACCSAWLTTAGGGA